MRLEEPPIDDHAIDEDIMNNHDVAFGQNAFNGSSAVYDLQFDDTDMEIIQQSFPELMDQLDDDDDRIVDQYFNDEEIQDCDDVIATAKEIEQALLQEDEFQEPQQPNTSFNETTTTPVSHSEQADTQVAPESCQDVPRKAEEHCRNATSSLSQLDPHPEIKNGVIICVLNRESDEIPDNDHLNPQQLHNPKPRSISMNPSSSSSLKKHMKPPLPPTRGSSFSQARGHNEIIQRDCVVTTQAICSSAFKDSFAEKATYGFAATTSTSQLHNSPENEICEQTLRTEMDVNAPILEEEEHLIEIESDEDLPSYSDVEAMVYKLLLVCEIFCLFLG